MPRDPLDDDDFPDAQEPEQPTQAEVVYLARRRQEEPAPLASERLFDIVAERICVASAILDPDGWEVWRKHCNAAMVYDPNLRHLMHAYEAAHRARGVAVHGDVLEAIDREKDPELWRLAFDLGKWAGGDIERYCRAVAILHEQRKAAAAAAAALRDFHAATSYVEKHEALERVKAIHHPTLDPPAQEEQTTALLLRIQDELEHGRVGGPAVRTSLQWLDDKLGGGLRTDRLYILAARPGGGKTSLALGMAIVAAQDGHRVAVVSLEMSKEDLLRRAASWISGVNAYTRFRDDDDRMRFRDALAELQDLDLHVWDKPLKSFDEMAEWLTALHSEKPLGMVMVDYLGLMPGRGEDREDLNITKNTQDCKNLSKTLKVPVVLLAQPNRMAESQGRTRYRMSDLNGSSGIEAAADAVIFLWRPKDGDRAYEDGYAEIDMQKNRHGPTGVGRLQWNGPRFRFEDSNGELGKVNDGEQLPGKR